MNINKLFYAGRLTRDVELRYTPSGTAIASFSVATNRSWMKDGEKHEEVCFVEMVCYGKRGEAIDNHFSKGREIFVEAHLKLDRWESKSGEKRSVLKAVVDDFQFVGPKAEGESNKNNNCQPVSDKETAPSIDINEEDVPF